MNAEIIAVGTELLLGQVVNTNATFLSEELAALGFEVYYHSVVGDNAQRLSAVVSQSVARSDLLVICGGLGPTEDDITKEVIASILHKPLVSDERARQKLIQFFASSKRTMTLNNLRQIHTISGAQTLQNANGLAVGVFARSEEADFLLLPGPPNELQSMFFKEAQPLLKRTYAQNEHIESVVLRFYGIGESQLATELADLIARQTNPTIAPYAKPNEVTLRLTVKAQHASEAQQQLKDLETEILSRVGQYFYGYGESNSLAQVTVQLLQQKQKTISAAESLTAGLFQSTLGDVAGVSQVFNGGFVTYAKEAKEQLLGISPEKLTRYGMVSEFCAVAMAERTRELTNTDLAISFTGVAGPNELENQPVGTVWIGLSERNQPPVAYRYVFDKDRHNIRHRTVMEGLHLIWQRLR